MRILIIEDEPRIRAFVTRGLAAEGFRVESSDDGAEGLRHALEGPFDLVILDLLLPGTDGLTVLGELQQQRPRLPVLVLSARGDLTTKLRSFQLGARDYLAKPFSLDELIARVRVQLSRQDPKEGESGNVLRVGGLTLDLARRQASLDGIVAALSDREFHLLNHLLEHSGEVVSRQRLLAEVWGYDFDPGSNVVDVCVRRLRKKLGPNAAIETVRHAGYRLSAA
jgi:two-component system, OmpR family, copper resistance phosphate regulon response regulator CusR